MDHLIGLKENVIIGKLVPAGTGMKCYSDVEIQSVNGPDDEGPAPATHEEEREEDFQPEEEDLFQEDLEDENLSTEDAEEEPELEEPQQAGA